MGRHSSACTRARPAAPADAMQPLVAAAFIERTSEGARFAFDSGWQCRICILADDLFRVLFIPPDGLREPRTWMVAPGGIDVPWEGRNRLDVSAFERPPFDLEGGDQATVLQTAALRARSAATPVRRRLVDTGQSAFCRRPSDPCAYEWNRRTNAIRHYMVATIRGSLFRPRRQDRPVRQAWPAARAPLRSTRWATTRRRAIRSTSTGRFSSRATQPAKSRTDCSTTRSRTRLSISAASTTTITGFYRYCEIEDGDLDYYVFVGERDPRRDTQVHGPDRSDDARSPVEPRLLEHGDEPHRRRRRAGKTFRFRRPGSRARHTDQRVSSSAPATAASAAGATCSPGIATRFPIRTRSSRGLRTQACASSPISSRACSMTTRPMTTLRHVARSSAMRRRGGRRSASSGTVKARTSISRIRRACDGGRTA